MRKEPWGNMSVGLIGSSHRQKFVGGNHDAKTHISQANTAAISVALFFSREKEVIEESFSCFVLRNSFGGCVVLGAV